MHSSKKIYLLSRWFHLHKMRHIARILFYINQIIFSCCLPPTAEIDPSVRFYHNALGVVVHVNAKIKENVIIFQHATIGSRWKQGADEPGASKIEKDVLIGAGACILGNITIGRGARIGANAVILTDVPAGATVVGVEK